MKFLSLLILRLRKLRIILLQPMLRTAFFRHFVMAGVEHKTVLNRSLATVVDIGANRGQFALAARAITGAKIISFEPLPEVANIFRTIFADDSSVILHVAAIGDKSEKTTIHLSARDDSSSLLEIGEAQASHFPGTHEVGTLDVEVGTLDQFLKQEDILRPAMLKMDVQGYELQALAGCRGLIRNFDFIYCECSFVELYKDQRLAGEVVRYLGELGFCLSGIYNPSYDLDGNCIQADLLFTPLGK